MTEHSREPPSDDPQRYFKDFICTCGTPPGAAERLARADVLMGEVRARLAEGSAELRARPVDATNLLTAVVVSLNWDFDAHITGIPNDQWSAVEAETYSRANDGEPIFRTYIQCDLVEHGVAATWNAFAERFPEKLARPADAPS